MVRRTRILQSYALVQVRFPFAADVFPFPVQREFGSNLSFYQCVVQHLSGRHQAVFVEFPLNRPGNGNLGRETGTGFGEWFAGDCLHSHF